MTQAQFIEEVAKYVKKYAPQYGIKVYSPIIAQFCLESGYGTSNKVKTTLPNGTVDWRHNYAGLKWRNNRCAISNDYFEEGTSEQNTDGTYTSITSKFFRFKSLEDCVIGYFQFTNISAYANLKGVTDPQTYLENIKKDKYATSIDYVQKNMNVIKQWNLTKYDDKKEEINVTQNNLTGFINATINGIKVNTSYPCNASNYENIGARDIKYIVMHYTGNTKDTALNNAKYFQGANREASAHFFVDDNSIYQSVELRYKAWHCGTRGTYYHAECRNTNSIGIEMCCSGNYIVSEKTKENSIYLCASLCKFIGIDASNVDKYVVRHWDVVHKNCPRQMAGANNAEWLQFLTNVKQVLNGQAIAPIKTTTTTSTTASSTTRSYLKRGDSGAPVKTMQENLNTLGYNCGTADGVFGANTETALKKFQKDYKLDVDGMYGAASRKALEDTVAKKITPSTPSIYKVQKGDTLSKIGNYTGFAWKNIADLNNIKFPYVIKVGQILQLPVKSATHTAPFKVKLKCNLDIKKSPNGETLKANGAHKGIMYTIVEINGEWGLLKSYQKNRNGWINISDKNAQRV